MPASQAAPLTIVPTPKSKIDAANVNSHESSNARKKNFRAREHCLAKNCLGEPIEAARDPSNRVSTTSMVRK